MLARDFMRTNVVHGTVATSVKRPIQIMIEMMWSTMLETRDANRGRLVKAAFVQRRSSTKDAFRRFL
jgi:hypothetical protein